MKNDYVFCVDKSTGINTLDAKTNVLMQIKMLLRHRGDIGVYSYGRCGNNDSPFVYVTCTEDAKNILEKELKGVESVYKKPRTFNAPGPGL